MSEKINLLTALRNQDDLIVPTAAQVYRLGLVVETEDEATKVIHKYMYVGAHTGLTAYQPYVIGNAGVDGGEVITAAPATLSAPGSLVCVPQVAFTSAYYGFVQIQGIASCLVTAETYAAGDTMQILNAGTALVVDGSTGSPAITVNTSAIIKETGTTAVARSIYLIGRPAVVAAT